MKKSERLNQELIYLSGKTTFNLSDLMAEFSISKRTALRDIEALENLGLPIYVENGRYGGYRLVSQKPVVPVYFNLEEIKALFFALKALTLLSSTPFHQSYGHIRQKLFATLSSTQQKIIEQMLEVIDYHSVPPLKKLDHLDLILQGIIEEKILSGDNLQHGRKPVELQIGELFYRSGVWFCSAWNYLTNEWGTYRCDYLENLEFKEIPGKFTLEELQEKQQYYEAHYHHTLFRCKLTDFGKELFLKRNYPNMHLTQKEGNFYIEGGYNKEELTYMTQYLISMGKHVYVEYPEELQKSVQKELAFIQRMYENNG